MKELKIGNTKVHTYKLKQERSSKIILKHMPPQKKIVAIKRDMEELEHKITNIWNIKKNGTKMPLK